jgi:hypothetical protein
LCDVFGEEVKDKLLDVVEHSASFFDSVDDRGEVVVGKDNVRGIFRDIRAGLSHGDPDICALQRGRIVDSVAGLSFN